MSPSGAAATHAIRAVVRGRVQGVGFRDATVRRAQALGVSGWVRNGADGEVLVHAEGEADAVAALEAFLREGPRGARVSEVTVERVAVEGHEQFAIRGVPAGRFVVRALERGFELRLEVDGATRAWLLPKGPSMEPAQKRLALELSAADAGPADAAGVVWDAGLYEQGGRVPWPAALDRGHAVFVLHGERLRGGFALQRTGRGDASGPPQWLLVKRRERADAVPGGSGVSPA
ncbi:MAG: acylphosphatase [Conexibacter sp.]